MPKDATKNIDRYKVRGGELNEFDFHQNQEAYAEQQPQGQAVNLIPGTPPERRKAIRTITKTSKATKGTKSTKKKKPTGASAKKLATRKAATKKAATKKSSTKRASTKKKTATKKKAAKKK